MLRFHFVFCHGWGFDIKIMQPLAQALHRIFPDVGQYFFDLGFTGAPVIPELRQDSYHCYIAIGHSYGFAYLLQMALPWRGMVAINGFTHFCRLPHKIHGLPLAILENTYTRLLIDTRGTIQDFYRRCGADANYSVGSIDFQKEILAQALHAMRNLNLTLPACPVLALATRHDQIVTPWLTHENFSSTQVCLIWLPGDHLLPLKLPHLCADEIAKFVTQLYV